MDNASGRSITVNVAVPLTVTLLAVYEAVIVHSPVSVPAVTTPVEELIAATLLALEFHRQLFVTSSSVPSVKVAIAEYDRVVPIYMVV